MEKIHVPDNPVLVETSLPGVQLVGRGKVRDIYAVGDRLLIITTDRISAFDYILATGVPDKGRVLNQITLFWLDFVKDIVPNHLITSQVSRYPLELSPFQDQLEGRSVLVKKADMVQVECVARGYLSGSGLKEYNQTGAVCGIALPPGLVEGSQLPEPIFTPSTKATSGHDQNVSFEHVAKEIGLDLADRLRGLTLDIYRTAAKYARDRGIIIADTKFEFGFVDDKLILADEVMTPDSSRFWPADTWAPGGPQPSYDKQYVRDYLESIHWNKQPPAPGLPDDVARRTSEKVQAGLHGTHRTHTVNSLDFVLLIILGWSVVAGFLAGFTRVGIGFIAMVLGILFGMWFYFIPAGWIQEFVQSSTASNLLGFFIVFALFLIAGAIVGRILGRMLKLVGLSFFDRLAGAAFGFVRGSVLVVAVMTVITAFAPTPPPQFIVHSKVAPYAATAGNVLAFLAPRSLKEGYRDTLAKLRHVWDKNDPTKEKKSGGA